MLLCHLEPLNLYTVYFYFLILLFLVSGMARSEINAVAEAMAAFEPQLS